MMEIYCPHCGYQKTIMENEFTEQEQCPLCNEILILKEESINLDKNKIYEFGTNKKSEAEIENEKHIEEINEVDDKIFKTMSELYVKEIMDYGEQRLWDNINFMPLDRIIWNIEWYLEALYIIKNNDLGFKL